MLPRPVLCRSGEFAFDHVGRHFLVYCVLVIFSRVYQADIAYTVYFAGDAPGKVIYGGNSVFCKQLFFASSVFQMAGDVIDGLGPSEGRQMAA